MRICSLLPIVLMLSGCGDDGDGTSTPPPAATPSPTPAPAPAPSATTAVNQRIVATFDNPWAMVFLPDGRMLVTE